MFTASPRIALKLPRGIKASALAVSLVLSALLTAVALRSPDDRWLAWISFLPLFVAVRWLRPAKAASAGGLWGAALFLFSTAGPTPGVEGLAPAVGRSAGLLALLVAIPAVYVALAARLTRAIGFKLLTLALGWVLIEAVVGLHNLPGPHDGLPTGSRGEGPNLHWLVRLLGYVSTAFLVACANASLVGILSGARLSFPTCRISAGSPNAGAHAPSQGVIVIQSWPLRQVYPRAPPIQIAVPSRNLAGSAHRSL